MNHGNVKIVLLPAIQHHKTLVSYLHTYMNVYKHIQLTMFFYKAKWKIQTFVFQGSKSILFHIHSKKYLSKVQKPTYLFILPSNL